MAKFTPGQWKFEATQQRLLLKGHEVYSEETATIVCFTDGLDPEAEANANLIAAAPDLLSAAETIEFHIRTRLAHSKLITDDELAVLQKAIAKAKGETK